MCPIHLVRWQPQAKSVTHACFKSRCVYFCDPNADRLLYEFVFYIVQAAIVCCTMAGFDFCEVVMN